MMNRRSFLFGASASLVAAPAIVRVASLMPVRGIVMPVPLTVDVGVAMEGYVAHRWGLAGNLPANHPFKHFPPNEHTIVRPQTHPVWVGVYE